MAIDFHDVKNQAAYTGRDAHPDWAGAIRDIVDPAGKLVADVGCGGGIYSVAWAAIGAERVTGVDFSAQMVSDAQGNTQKYSNIAIQQGNALATGLAAGSADIVFERALIHHIGDRVACFKEAHRVLKADGLCIVQDRTPDDVMAPAAADHMRGYFFEAFPRLLDVENGRRPAKSTVKQELREAGFTDIQTRSLWEIRRIYGDLETLATDLRHRTGRSILHELSDGELEELIAFILKKLDGADRVVERDRWTIWVGRKAH